MHGCLMGGSFSAPGTTPIQDRLLGYSHVRALVFGRYGEASADVHALLAAVASARASRASRVRRRWGGADGGGGAYVAASFIASVRRSLGVGVFVARELGRHRLHRIPLVGVTRDALAFNRGARGPTRFSTVSLSILPCFV